MNNNKIDLDNSDQLNLMDSYKMVDAVMAFPSHFPKALDLMRNFFLPPNFPNPRKIIIIGAGNLSVIIGSLIKDLFSNTLICPVTVHNGFNMPAWVDKHTLAFILSSYEDKAETVNSFKEILARKAKAILITSNPRFAEAADAFNIPLISFEAPGIRKRALLAYFFIPIIMILERMGLIDSKYKRQVEEVIETLVLIRNECRVDNIAITNPAKQIASALYSKTPVIYGVRGVTESAAIRWKSQLCENGKTLSYYNLFPDLTDDEMIVWEVSKGVMNFIQPVFLKHSDNDEIIIRQQNKLKENIEKRLGRKIIEVYSKGSSLMTKNFSLMYMGDWVSLYSGFLYGIDPGS